MADQWFYQMFGEEFGPVPFEKLKELAELGTVSAEDNVRPTTSTQWVLAGSIDSLGLAGDTGATSVAIASNSVSGGSGESFSKSGQDDWFCRVHGQELGPLNFDELVKLAENENLSSDDEVKLGASGKWRRVGSMGRLMAVLPYQSSPRSNAPSIPQPTLAAEEPAVPVTKPTSPKVSADRLLAEAQATYQVASDQAMAQVAWAFAPTVDPYWWGWIGGVEYGPTGFTQVMDWARSGQLQPTDFVRNGQYGQYVPSNNIPGLFAAVSMQAQAMAVLTAAQAQAAELAETPALPSVTSSPVAADVSKPHTSVEPVISKTQSVAKAVASVSPSVKKPESSTSGDAKGEMAAPSAIAQPKSSVTSKPDIPKQEPEISGSNSAAASAAADSQPARPSYSSPMPATSSVTASKPVAFTPPRPAPKASPSRSGSSFSISDSLEFLKDPKALGAIGALAVLLLVVGWQYLPKSSAGDIKHYHELKHILDEIRVKRSNKSGDFTAIVSQAERASKEITAALKDTASRDYPAKQFLLWAARDELPRMMAELQQAPAQESKSEANFAARLKEAARELRLE